MPTLTIAILNWNGKDYLEECLASIPQDLEAERILVDNASTDDSWKIAEKYGFRVVHADNKHKFITGINTALREAKGDCVLFSQGDVKFTPGSIFALKMELDYWDIIQPVFINQKRGVDNSGMKWIWPGYGIGERKFKGRIWTEPTDICTSITFITNRNVLEAVGLYDEKFSPAYYEDVDWALRSKRLGINHKVCHKAIVLHRHNESFSKEYNKLAISRICRKNRRYLINKHYRGLDRLLRLTVSSCLDIVKEAFDVIRDRWITSHNRHKFSV